MEGRFPGATRVRVRLETGRRNQIRVHFAEALTAWTIAKRRRNFGRLLVDGIRAPYTELVP